MSDISRKIRQMIEAVLRSIRLDTVELPEEFFPAHLPVALIDSVVRSVFEYDPHTVRSTERYCHRFGIERTRAERLETPPADEQETLADLVKRFEELGVDRMADEVFSGRQGAPGAESVLNAAMALRQIRVEVLQDVPARSPDAIEDALRFSGEAGKSAGRRLMMYAGDDDFVRGDIHVRTFVAHAIGQRAVSADQAEQIVRQSAYEMILSPRYLDYQIWKYGEALPTSTD